MFFPFLFGLFATQSTDTCNKTFSFTTDVTECVDDLAEPGNRDTEHLDIHPQRRQAKAKGLKHGGEIEKKTELAPFQGSRSRNRVILTGFRPTFIF